MNACDHSTNARLGHAKKPPMSPQSASAMSDETERNFRTTTVSASREMWKAITAWSRDGSV